MKEITRIHLAKIPYEIEIDAKNNFEKYLKELEKFTDKTIFQDVEIRITEILSESGIKENGIITVSDVEKVRAQIGEPEVFRGEDFSNENSSSNKEDTSNIKNKTSTPHQNQKTSYFERLKNRKLYRIRENAMIDGVCSGLAEFFELDTTIMRVLVLISFFLTAGWTLLIYIVLCVVTPVAKNANDILRLRGEPISAESIRNINQEFDFEKTKKRDQRALRILGIFLGMLSVMVVFFGIWCLFMGNFVLQEAFQQGKALFEINETSRLLLIGLSNLAGIAFVIFWLTLAKASFSLKFSRNHFVISMMCIAIGVSSMIGFFTVSRDAFEKQNDKLLNSLKVSSINFDKNKLSNIKTIENKTRFQVEYFVSDQRKIEIGEFESLKQNLAKNTHFEFDGETLRISSNQEQKYWIPNTDAYKIRIYGPELSKVATESKFRYNLNREQESELEAVISNIANADFKVAGSGKVRNLKILTRNSKGELTEIKDKDDIYEYEY